jgi:hypothetical protein
MYRKEDFNDEELLLIVDLQLEILKLIYKQFDGCRKGDIIKSLFLLFPAVMACTVINLKMTNVNDFFNHINAYTKIIYQNQGLMKGMLMKDGEFLRKATQEEMDAEFPEGAA